MIPSSIFYHMVEHSPALLDLTYAALADPTRRAILDRLRTGEARVTDLARQFPISLNAVSKHIRVLEGAGLVRRDVRGREHLLSLEAAPLAAAGAWIADYRTFWTQRADALARHVEQRARRGDGRRRS
jgi:DNA-binding transcriptional ArsR family regulator